MGVRTASTSYARLKDSLEKLLKARRFTHKRADALSSRFEQHFLEFPAKKYGKHFDNLKTLRDFQATRRRPSRGDPPRKTLIHWLKSEGVKRGVARKGRATLLGLRDEVDRHRPVVPEWLTRRKPRSNKGTKRAAATPVARDPLVRKVKQAAKRLEKSNAKVARSAAASLRRSPRLTRR